MTKVYIQKSFPPEQVFYITDSSGNYLGSFDIDEDPIKAINEAMKKSTMVEDNVEKEEKDAEMSNNNNKMSPFEYALRQSLAGQSPCGRGDNECCRSTKRNKDGGNSYGAFASGLVDFLNMLDEVITVEEKEHQKSSHKDNQDKPQSKTSSSEKDGNDNMTLEELVSVIFTEISKQQSDSVDAELRNTIQKRNKLAQSLNTQIDDSINSMTKTLSMIRELQVLEECINNSPNDYERSKELDNILDSIYKMSYAFHSLKSLKKTL